MKKVIFLLLIFIRILSFSFENNYSNEIEKLANDKKAIKMYYLSQNNDGIIKKWYLYNDNVFQKEFEANEQRAINMLQDKNSIFLYLFSKGILLCPKPGCIKILEDMSKLNFSPDELLI